MNATPDVMAGLREQTLEYVKAGHEAALTATRSFYESVGSMMPDLGPLGSMLSVPTTAVGDPKQYFEASFAFAHRVLEMEREFAHKQGPSGIIGAGTSSEDAPLHGAR